MLLSAYAGATTLAAPALRAMLRRRIDRGKELADRLPERFGIDPTPRPAGRLLWLHAASVGETMSVLPVLSALPERLAVLMTTGTLTSTRLLAERLPALGLAGRVRHRFVPLDVPAWVARFLDHWRPDAAAFVESEIWPNMLSACAGRQVPMVLLNARLSARSFGRWRLLPGLARALFGAFGHVLAQSDADAERLRQLGASDVASWGNLKFAAPALPADAVELDALRSALGGGPVLLAASTHPGEEAALLAEFPSMRAHHPEATLVIVPRHPERGAEVAALVSDVKVARRATGDPPHPGGVYVADTLGELGLFYRLASLAFVGGSLVPHGGQNPLEAARLGCPVAVGPHAFNFADAVEVLERAGALVQVKDAGMVMDWAMALLDAPVRRAAMGQAGIAASRRAEELPARVAALLAQVAGA
jgi:3-deoxy-D-manno-octulosonic-acid transferase